MTEQLLLALKVGFLVVLYVFIWRVIRLSRARPAQPQESMILGAAAAEAGGLGRAGSRAAERASTRGSSSVRARSIRRARSSGSSGRQFRGGPTATSCSRATPTSPSQHARVRPGARAT